MEANRVFLTALVDVFMIAAALFAMFTIFERATDRAADWHDLYTKDSAMLIDAMIPSAGDLELVYSSQPEYYSKLELDKYLIGRPRTTRELEEQPFSEDNYDFLAFGFGTSSRTTIQPATSDQEHVMFRKTGSTITLEGQASPLQLCSQVRFEKAPLLFQVRSPSHQVNPQAYALTIFISDLVKSGLERASHLTHTTTSPDLVVEFVLDNEEEARIKIEHSDELEAQKLACLINVYVKEYLLITVPYENTGQKTTHYLRITLGNKDSLAVRDDQRELLSQALSRAIILGTRP